MGLGKILSSDGKYSCWQYNTTEVLVYLLMVGLVFLVFISNWFLILTIPGCLFLWVVHVQATIKRLHDLGKEEGDYIKLFIPFVGTFMNWQLHWQSGMDEQNQEAYYDYRRKQHERRYGNYRPKDDLGRPL